MTRTVRDVMTTALVVVKASAPFKDIVGLMEEFRVSALPVVDDEGTLVGIVSEGDLLLKEQYAVPPESRLFEGRGRRRDRRKAEGLVAADLMTSPVVTATRETTLPQAARLMHDRKVKRLPVVDAAGKAIGIVSRADLLKVFLRPDQEIRREVVDEVLVRILTIDPRTVRVEVAGGVVRLEGQLERASLLPVLVGLIKGVDGVVGVEERLSFEVDDVRFRPDVITPWGVFAPSLRPQR